MTTAKQRQELLATWKHCSSVLGCNPNYQKQLGNLAQNIWQQLRGSPEGLLFLLNPYTPELIRNVEFAKLIKTRPSQITSASRNLFLEALASSNLLTTTIEEDILESGKRKLIILMAKNPNTTSDTLLAIAQQNDRKYLKALIENPNTTNDILGCLSQVITIEELPRIMEHPNMSRELLQHLGHRNLTAASLHSYHKACVKLSSDIAEIESLIQPETEIDMLRAVASNIQLWQHYWRSIIMSGDFLAILQLASNRSVSTNVLKTMIHPMQREEIKIAIAAREDIPAEILLLLLADDSSQVRLAASQNLHIHIPGSVIHELAFDEWDENVLTALLTRPETAHNTLKAYFDRIVTPQCLRVMLINAKPGISELTHYAVAVDPGLLSYAVQRSDCSAEIIEEACNSPVLTEQIAGIYAQERCSENVVS